MVETLSTTNWIQSSREWLLSILNARIIKGFGKDRLFFVYCKEVSFIRKIIQKWKASSGIRRLMLL